jgi:endonuclease-3
MKPAVVAELFTRFRAANPKPTTELEYSSPFELLIAVLLSAQATDVGVNKATRKLFPVARTPQAMYALGVEGLTEYVKTIGLYRNKAKNAIETCRILIEQHGGQVPRDREALEALPGVGRKTANVVLNTAFGEPTIAVDTHIFRVSNRLSLAPGKNVDVVEHKLLKVVPAEFKLDAHHWLILHGRYVCKALKPECWRCPVSDLCTYKPKTPDPEAAATAKPARKPVAQKIAEAMQPSTRKTLAGSSTGAAVQTKMAGEPHGTSGTPFKKPVKKGLQKAPQPPAGTKATSTAAKTPKRRTSTGAASQTKMAEDPRRTSGKPARVTAKAVPLKSTPAKVTATATATTKTAATSRAAKAPTKRAAATRKRG